MFGSTSRYNGVKTTTTTIAAGDGTTRTVRYVQRRIIPPPDDSLTEIEYTVTESDRPDNIAAFYLGDPTAYWMLCDANNVLSPDDLTETVGRVIKIVLPQI